MILYSWTVLSAMTTDAVVAMGITSSRERAWRDAEEPLLDGRAFLAVIESVRPVTAKFGLGPCYMHAGISWVGQRNHSGAVQWRRFWAGPGPAGRIGT